MIKILSMSHDSKAPTTMKAEIDMSPRAIALRLDEMRALYDLMRYLSQFRPKGETEAKLRR